MRRPKPAHAGTVEKPRASVRPRRMDPAERRSELMRVALEVFARDGLGFARHAEIAKEAGVALATVFHYFPTRNVLVADVLEEVDRFFIKDVMETAMAREQSAPEAILALLMGFADSIDRFPSHAQIWLEWSSSVRDEIWKSYLSFYERATSYIAQIVEHGIGAETISATLDPMDVARIVVGLAHPIAHMKFSGRSRETIEHTMVSLVGQYLKP
ncbi:TetR/AcrR family transcriptional regulator [Thauera propionica]|uniref:TetR/AcrR family transcriptional regulator n=1 Tax=Thauera propionica TaxID=2019431 RepID=UPI0023F5771A|nr:TetR/AcrR family transcriptional regulator [Thauera propionica]MDD3674801.1 TetR/AcrR family transcriptional regulator [Thauera propionica]